MIGEELVEPLSRGRFDDEAEHIGTEIRVLVELVRVVRERRLDD